MPAKKNEVTNQYLFYLLKYAVSFHCKGEIGKELKEKDYAVISKEGDNKLSIASLKKMYTDPKRYSWGNKTLNLLTFSLPKESRYWGNYLLFKEKEGNNPLCRSIEGRPVKEIPEDRLREIKKKATRRAIEIVEDKYEPAGFNIPWDDTGEAFIGSIRLATEEDIHKIYQFALNRYDACDLNPPAIKIPWWKRNQKIFYVIPNEKGNIKANINLLPVTPDCYRRLKYGIIAEKEISDLDIIPLSSRETVRHIFVEGLNCATKEVLMEIANSFQQMIYTLAVPSDQLLIGAIGGTIRGEKLMYRLGFEANGVYKQEQYEFFEVSYDILSWELDKIKAALF